MKKKYLFLCFILVARVLFSSPVWFQSPRNFYDADVYLAGIGEGDSYDSAMAVARSELIQQISVNVKVDNLVSFLYEETENRITYTETINQNIQLTSEKEIQGIEILRQEQVRGRYYVMLGINKQRMLRNMELEITELWRSIQSSLQNAERHVSNGQIVFAVTTYHNIQESLIELYTIKAIYDAFSTRALNINQLILLSDVDNLMRDLLSAIKFEVVSGDYQTVRRGVLLPHPILFRASLNLLEEDNGVIPLRNLPVVLTYGDGQHIENGYTNENGEFSTRPVAIPNVSNLGRIVIKINSEQFPLSLYRFLQNIVTEASFSTTEPEPIKVHLTIVDERGRNVQSAYNRVSNLFRENNILIDSNASIIAHGVASVTNRLRDSDGGWFCEVDVNIEFSQRQNRQVIGNLYGTGVMRGQSQEVTIDRAFGAIQLNTEDIRDIVLKIEGF